MRADSEQPQTPARNLAHRSTGKQRSLRIGNSPGLKPLLTPGPHISEPPPTAMSGAGQLVLAMDLYFISE